MIFYALREIANNYLSARKENYAGHSFAAKFREIGKTEIQPAVNDIYKDFVFKSSPGLNDWTHTPWISLMDPEITETAQEGYYIVYLFSKNIRIHML